MVLHLQVCKTDTVHIGVQVYKYVATTGDIQSAEAAVCAAGSRCG